MHLDPDQRYGSCGELAVAVTQALGLTGAGAALPILRDIQDRLRAESTGRDRTTAYSQPMPPTGAEPPPASTAQTRNMLLSTLAAVLAVALAGGLLLYQLFTPDDAGAAGDAAAVQASIDAAASSQSAADAAALLEHEPPPPTVEPVTGDAQVERIPVEGECVTDSDIWTVVACDSPLADELIFKIVMNPDDPNPKQPDHDDAAWEACSGEGYDFDYEWYWSDSLDEDETDREWDPEIDSIRYIMCYVEL
jgi:hypothetical protein